MAAAMVKLEESRARFLAVRSSHGLEVVFKQMLEVVERNELLRSTFFNHFNGSYDSKCKEIGRSVKEYHAVGVLPSWDEEEWVSYIHLLLSENALIWGRLPAECKVGDEESSGDEGEADDENEVPVDEVEDDAGQVSVRGVAGKQTSCDPTSMAAHGRVAGVSWAGKKSEVEDDDVGATSHATSLPLTLSKGDNSANLHVDVEDHSIEFQIGLGAKFELEKDKSSPFKDTSFCPLGSDPTLFGQTQAANDKESFSPFILGEKDVCDTNTLEFEDGAEFTLNGRTSAANDKGSSFISSSGGKGVNAGISYLGSAHRKDVFPFPNLSEARNGPLKEVHNPLLIATKDGLVGAHSPSKDWAGLFKSTPKSSLQVGLVDLGDAVKLKKLPMKVSMATKVEDWAHCLVGHFLGKTPAYSIVCSIAFNHWKKIGLKEVLATDSGFFFFKFDSLDHRDLALEFGSWNCHGQPIFLRKWHTNLKLEKDAKKKIPIWVKFFNLPLEYWNSEGFSRVGSMIGTPLCVDSITEKCQRISYAHIYIEIDFESELLHEFEVVVEDDRGNSESIKIDVQYKWTPPKCAKCKCFGHDCEKRSHPHTIASREIAPRNSYKPKILKEEWKVVPKKGKGKEVLVDVRNANSKVLHKESTEDVKSSYFAALESFDEGGPSNVTMDNPREDAKLAVEKHNDEVLDTTSAMDVARDEVGGGPSGPLDLTKQYSPHIIEEDDIETQSEDAGSVDGLSIEEDHHLQSSPNHSKKNGSSSRKKKKNKQRKKR